MTNNDYPALTQTEAAIYTLHEKIINPVTGRRYTHREIGEKLGIATHTSEVMLSRARKRLRDMEVTLEVTGHREQRQRNGRLDKAVDLLNKMLAVLMDLLEEKGVLTHDEWDSAVRREIENTKNLKKI